MQQRSRTVQRSLPVRLGVVVAVTVTVTATVLLLHVVGTTQAWQPPPPRAIQQPGGLGRGPCLAVARRTAGVLPASCRSSVTTHSLHSGSSSSVAAGAGAAPWRRRLVVRTTTTPPLRLLLLPKTSSCLQASTLPSDESTTEGDNDDDATVTAASSSTLSSSSSSQQQSSRGVLQRVKGYFNSRKKKDDNDGLTFRQQLAKMGLAAALSYGWVSNMSYSVTVSLAWYIHSKQTGLSPLAPGQWKSFLAVYAGFWVFNNVVRPIRLAAAVAISPQFDRFVLNVQTRFRLSKSAAVAVTVVLANVVGTTACMTAGIAVAAAVAGVPVFP